MTYRCTCAHRVRLSLDEAFELAQSKANLDWVPVVPEVKAEPVAMGPVIHLHLPESLTHNLELPTPQVHVEPPVVNVAPPIVNIPEAKAPVVNVPAPIVNVEAPVVNVPEAKASLPQEVRVIEMPQRVHEVIRDPKGKVNGSVERDV